MTTTKSSASIITGPSIVSSASIITGPSVVVTSVVITVTPTGIASDTVATVFVTQSATTATLHTSSLSLTTSSGATSQPTAAITGEAHASKSTRTVIGTVVGIVLAIIVGAVLAFYFVRRRRRGQRNKATALDIIGDHHYHNKPELAGSDINPEETKNIVGVIFSKPELEDTSVAVTPLAPYLPAEAIDEPGTLPYVSTASFASSTTEKQVLESERYPRPYPEAIPGQSQLPNNHTATANSAQHSLEIVDTLESPKYFVDGPSSHLRPGAHPDPNNETWVGGERWMPATYERPDSLSRLRAEQEALLERIRLAEQRELERSRLQP